MCIVVHSKMIQLVRAGSYWRGDEKRKQLTRIYGITFPNQQELDDYAKYYQNIEEERQDVAEHGRRRILSVLNPEQQKLFRAMFKAQTLPLNRQSGR